MTPPLPPDSVVFAYARDCRDGDPWHVRVSDNTPRRLWCKLSRERQFPGRLGEQFPMPSPLPLPMLPASEVPTGPGASTGPGVSVGPGVEGGGGGDSRGRGLAGALRSTVFGEMGRGVGAWFAPAARRDGGHSDREASRSTADGVAPATAGGEVCDTLPPPSASALESESDSDSDSASDLPPPFGAGQPARAEVVYPTGRCCNGAASVAARCGRSRRAALPPPTRVRAVTWDRCVILSTP